MKYWNRRRFNCPLTAPWGLYNEFWLKYYHKIFRNEFSCHENVGIDTLNELVGAIVWILCRFACKIVKSEKGWLPLNGFLGAVQRIWLKYYQNKFRNEFLDHKNIGIDTLTELVCAIDCVLCPFISFRLMTALKLPWWQILDFFFISLTFMILKIHFLTKTWLF